MKSSSRKLFRLAWIIAFSLFCFAPWTAPSVVALNWQQEEAEKQPDEPTEEEISLKKRLGDPRESMRTFLRAMESRSLEQAEQCLDLAWLDEATAASKGGTYADKLYFVLTQIWTLRTYQVSGDPEHEQPYQLSECFLNSADPAKLNDARLIQMTRNRNGLWRFSRITLEAVEETLWPKWQDRVSPSDDAPEALSVPVWISNQFPKFLRDKHFLLKDYQWICLLLLTALGFLAGRLSRMILDGLTRLWFHLTSTRVDDRERLRLWRPLSLLVNALVWYFGARWIDLPADFLRILLVGLKFLSVTIAVWTAFRAINLLANYLKKRADLTPGRYDDALVPLVSNVLKIASLMIGVLLFVDVFELDWKAVLGGFGLGGIALALASKDVLGNFFGSVTVLTDRPFEIGDSVVVDGNVEGTVEVIGMRSSRIRTFYGSETIVPNSLLTTAVVDNLGRRKTRRFKTKLQIDYRTPPDKLEAFCCGIRQMLEDNPHASKQDAYVYLHDFTDTSISILLCVFFDTSIYKTELQERHNLMRNVLRLADELKVSFAWPARSLRIHGEKPEELELPDSLEALEELGRSVASKIRESPAIRQSNRG